MKIAIDAMGGDNAPLEIVKGTYMAYSEYDDIELTLIGDEKQIAEAFNEIGQSIPDNLKIVHTDIYITMEDDPMVVMKEKNNSSMAIGLQMLKDGDVDAFLSAGNTGALHTASTLMVRKIKGVRRSAIAAVLPFKKPILMLDSGANPEVTEDILNQWAVVGSFYVEHMFGIEKPKVALLNNGTEEQKGTHMHQEAFKLLKENEHINFVGNVEARDVLKGNVDVVVSDGFAGNVCLKTLEGTVELLLGTIKTEVKKSIWASLGYACFMKGAFKRVKAKLDYKKFGGAPLLGTSKIVVKCHGNSRANSIAKAIEQVVTLHKNGMISKISKAVSDEE